MTSISCQQEGQQGNPQLKDITSRGVQVQKNGPLGGQSWADLTKGGESTGKETETHTPPAKNKLSLLDPLGKTKRRSSLQG